jgi:signal transduction histidine kinase
MNPVVPRHPGLEALRDGFCMLDPQWRLTYWNAAAESLSGVARERALGCLVWEAVPGVDEAIRERMAPAMTEGRRVEYARSMPTAMGPRLISFTVTPADGGVAVQFRDTAADEPAEKRYASLLGSIGDGFLAVDGEWRIVHVNAAARELLGLPPGWGPGLGLWKMLPERPESIRDVLRATMDDGEARRLLQVHPEGRAYGGRFFDLSTHGLPGGGVGLLFADVTDRLHRERELARLAAEAEEASRAKSRFFAAVSHELRTPLNAIVGYTHLLRTSTYGPVPAGAERAAERAGVCAEHLAALVDDVLLLTTTEVARLSVLPRPVDLAAFLVAALEPQRRQAEAKGLAFSAAVAPGLPPVRTDPERLRQALHALVANAIKFTSRGGVTITARLAADAAPEPAHGDIPHGVSGDANAPAPASPGASVEIAVVDTGPGIPAEDRERIFDAFEQLGDPARHDSMSRGTGLGLTIARQLAHLLGGSVAAEEAPGGGSIFRLRVPLAYKPPSA